MATPQSTNLKYYYIVDQAGPRAFTMPVGFRNEVKVHLWGAGGGSGAKFPGGGGGYALATAIISPGDIVEIGIGQTGAPIRDIATPGTGGGSGVGTKYSGGPGGVDSSGVNATGGGGGATSFTVNSTVIAVAAGGAGGGSAQPGKPGGVYSETIASGWYPTTLSYAWGSFMNTYAIWSDPNLGTKAFTKVLTFPTTGNYTFYYTSDNQQSWTLDNGTAYTSPADGFSTVYSQVLSVTAGIHTLSAIITNSGGPGGWAFRIVGPGSVELWNSRQGLDIPGLAASTQGASGNAYTFGGGGGGYYGGSWGQGGKNFGDIILPGNGIVAGGRTTEFAPIATYGNAGYSGYAVLEFTRKFQMFYKDTDWKDITNSYVKIPSQKIKVKESKKIPIGTSVTTSKVITKSYTSAGSFTVPENVSSLTITGCGGGGGGGGGDWGKNHNYNDGSGGGGSNMITTTFSVTPGQVLNYTVGEAGKGGESEGRNGYAGGITVVTGTGVSFIALGGGLGGGSRSPIGGAGANGAASGGNAPYNGIGLGGKSTNGGANGGNGGGYHAGGQPGQAGKLNFVYTEVTATTVVTYRDEERDVEVDQGGWKEVQQIFVKTNGQWKPLNNTQALNDGRTERWVVPGTYYWTAPTNVIRAKVIVYGAGGSGTGGGGGAGGYAEKYETITPGTTYSIVVGAGGVGNQNGQDSSFDATIVAGGGKAGTVSSSGTDAGGAGGTATGGDINLVGAAGSAGKAVYHYWYWWWGWGGYWQWGGYNYYNYGYGYYRYEYPSTSIINNSYWRGGYWGGNWGWGWPHGYRQTGYSFGKPGKGFDDIGSGSVGPAGNNPTGAPGAVFVIY